MIDERVAPTGATATIGSSSSPSLRDLIGVLIGDLRASLAARFDIAQIEARQSLGLVLRSFGAACAAVLLAFAAWWSICAALIVLAVNMGAPWVGALAGTAAANAALALGAARYARQRVGEVGMPHTRQLFLDPDQARTDFRPEQADVASDR
jgi:hypothetical protein